MIKVGRDRDDDNVFEILRVPVPRQQAKLLNTPLVRPLEKRLQRLGPVGEIVVYKGRRNRRSFC